MRPISFFLTVGLVLASADARAQKTTPISTPAPSPAAISAIPPAASAALARAVALYGDGAAHASAFTQIYTPAGFATARRESGTVVLQVPQRVRFDYTAPEKKAFTYDAGEGRFFSPDDKQLTVRRLSEEEKARLPIVFLTQPADLGRQYEIAVEPGEAASSTRILLTPRVPRPELAWLRLAIDGGGSVSGLSYQDSAGNRTEFRFDAWRTEKARPAADFRITGPPGTRIVEN
ncbi:MAG: outer membrane lipoprotein carrier protein LolA [Acidobacteriota bacterium]